MNYLAHYKGETKCYGALNKATDCLGLCNNITKKIIFIYYINIIFFSLNVKFNVKLYKNGFHIFRKSWRGWSVTEKMS